VEMSEIIEADAPPVRFIEAGSLQRRLEGADDIPLGEGRAKARREH